MSIESPLATVDRGDESPGTKTLGSAVKMLRVLETVAACPHPTVSEVAGRLGWGRGTAHQYLVTGVRSGWLARDGDEYVLSTRACAIGSAAAAAAGLTVAVRAEMHKLVKSLHEPISFAVLEGYTPRIIERVEPDRALQVRRAHEERMSVKTSASGQILLAWGGIRFRQDMRDDGIDLHPEELYAAVRNRGYTVINGHWAGDDVTAAAVPVVVDGKCRGALSAICPTGRTDPDFMREELCRARDDIENESRYTDAP